MDESAIAEDALRQVRALLEEGDIEAAKALLETLLPPDRADVFEELDPEVQRTLLPTLDAEDAAGILEEMDDAEAAELAEGLNSLDLARILDEMEPDEAADILGDLESNLSRAVLARMAEAEEVRPLLVHPDESAGGLMTTVFLAFPETMTVRQALASMRTGPLIEVPRLFVVDGENRLVGSADLFHVLRSAPTVRLSELVEPGIVTVHADDDQEAAARLMVRYDLDVVPVVDDDNCLVGAITADDLVDVLEEEATEDVQRLGGAEPLGRPYRSTSIAQTVRSRVGLLVLLLATFAVSSVIMDLFRERLEAAIILTFFVPMLMGTGGNTGSQTIATLIRALAVGDVHPGEAPAVLWRELRAGLVLGALLAAAAYLVVSLWGSPRVALAVGVSTLAIVVWANTLGALLPLAAARLRLDPALVSGPLLTTIIDATGLLIYFGIAGLILGI
jgi:magnesium transporter